MGIENIENLTGGSGLDDQKETKESRSVFSSEANPNKSGLLPVSERESTADEHARKEKELAAAREEHLRRTEGTSSERR